MKRYTLLILTVLMLAPLLPFAETLKVFDESQSVVEFTGLSQQKVGAFNGSIPPIEDLYAIPVEIDFRTCILTSSASANTPHYQDYVQAEDGSYYVLGTVSENAILIGGKSVIGNDAILMHLDVNGNCLDAQGYAQLVGTGALSSNSQRLASNSNWHTSGAHTLILLDEDWIVVTGTIGARDKTRASWGGVINSSSISGTSQNGEHFFVAKIARSNLSIEDWKIIPAWDSGVGGNGPCQQIGTYPQTFSNATEFAVAIDLSCYPWAGNSRSYMEISGVTYDSHYSSGQQTTRHTNILVRFNHNLSIIESAEIPSPHHQDGNINFLESGVAVALTGSGDTISNLLAHYRLPGQQWVEIDLSLDSICNPSAASILTLDGERFGWICGTDYSTNLQDVFLYVVNVTSGNTTQHDLGETPEWGDYMTYGGGFALNSHRILQHFRLDSQPFTTPNGLTFYGHFVLHYDLTTQNVSIAPSSSVMSIVTFKHQSTTESVRYDEDGFAESVDAFIGTSLMFQTATSDLKIYEIDQDNDAFPDRTDDFPFDSTQHIDSDSDGFGDNPVGNNPDDCPYLNGDSTVDLRGCPDNDGDGYSNQGDLFPNDATQAFDFDSDGYGDNLNGTFGDSCPSIYGESKRDRYGCLDADLDGWSDESDTFPNDSSQWEDTDGDGYGDQLIGFQGDSCLQTMGNSTEDRYGCPDADGDGWSDDGDALASNPTQWKDRDGDGYGDNATGTMTDSFPSDGTQWVDIDGDGHGDELFGNQGDAFPNDLLEWKDSDDDGLGDNADAFPFDPTQKVDADGDGMGDNPMGIGADKFPDDATQWGDIDGDGYGDNPN
jgi:hypothetical protein